MNKYPVLSVQDISCVGQCSLTVALPILSAIGHECAILPTALLSSHTAFQDASFSHLEDEIPSIFASWKKENIRFGGLYVGYVGSVRGVSSLTDIFTDFLVPNAPVIIDPVLGDNGELYRHFESPYVDAVRNLLPYADVILPNLTEACLLAGVPFTPHANLETLKKLHRTLKNLGAKQSVITGVETTPDRIAVSIDDGTNEVPFLYETPRIIRPSHGAGDVFASVVAGRIFSGQPLKQSAKDAVDFTYRALAETPDEHWYGLSFEPLLHTLKKNID